MDNSLRDFIAPDGTKIVYRSWTPETDSQGIIVLLHRGHEHLGRMETMAHYFSHRGYTVYAWDARGNGRSEGERDSAESFSVFAQDLQCFIQRIQEETGQSTKEMVIIASSMGAVIATSWVHDYAPKIRGLIIATPAFSIRLYVPFAIPLLSLARKWSLMPRVSSYVKSKVLTHDRKQQAIYNQDPLISSSISTDLLIDTYKTGQRLIDDASAITTPTLVLCAGQDWVVSRRAQRRFYTRLGSLHKEWAYFPNFYHALFHEDDTDPVFERCFTFIEQRFATPYIDEDFTNADQYGSTRDKYDQLSLPNYNPVYPITRWTLSTIGQLSDGIALGLKHGFDSGSSLDYVYKNQANGKAIIGKTIDRIYLNSPGWNGVRARKLLLETLLHQSINPADSFRILDIASGNGRYLLEQLNRYPNLHVEMRDFSQDNVTIIGERINQLAASERATAIHANAFDASSYLEEHSFDLAICSGLFELFPDNNPVKIALAGMAKQLKPGGYLIYTNQPWHSQQEFIAKTLGSHRNQPWIMRCRTQAEMDALVTQSGLEKQHMLIEPSGMFSVSIARKPLEQ